MKLTEISVLLFAIVLGAFFVTQAHASPATPACPVIPHPAEIQSSSGPFVLASPPTLVLCPGTDRRDREAAVELNLWLEELGLAKLRIMEYSDTLNTTGAILFGPPSQGSPVAAAVAALGRESIETPGGEGYLLAADKKVRWCPERMRRDGSTG